MASTVTLQTPCNLQCATVFVETALWHQTNNVTMETHLIWMAAHPPVSMNLGGHLQLSIMMMAHFTPPTQPSVVMGEWSNLRHVMKDQTELVTTSGAMMTAVESSLGGSVKTETLKHPQLVLKCVET